jgi:hypothetical protein
MGQDRTLALPKYWRGHSPITIGVVELLISTLRAPQIRDSRVSCLT